MSLLTDGGTGTDFSNDYVSTYSSRDPTLYDHVLKPDLLAPGNRVVAPISDNAHRATLLPDRVVACGGCDDYLELSGTSMVAATAAKMLHKDPTLTPDDIKARLMRSARKIPGDATETGAGVLDIDAALNETGFMSTVALSPKIARSDDGAVILVENTELLWGDPEWSAAYLWSDGYLWSDSVQDPAFIPAWKRESSRQSR